MYNNCGSNALIAAVACRYPGAVANASVSSWSGWRAGEWRGGVVGGMRWNLVLLVDSPVQ